MLTVDMKLPSSHSSSSRIGSRDGGGQVVLNVASGRTDIRIKQGSLHALPAEASQNRILSPGQKPPFDSGSAAEPRRGAPVGRDKLFF
jgi:ferric-dicitrate binding protein FerR (iron transport regulator)